MKDKYDGCYIDNYKDHYAVFADNGEKLAEYDNHKEAKEDIAEWEAEVKNESYIPADTLATGYRFTIRETELLENAIKKHVEQKVDQGVNSMFDTDSEEFKKVGNEPYDKSQWWDDMKLTMRIKKTPFPRKNGYTNGDFKPNQKWLMGAIECCKSARDCDYLLKDAYLSVAHDKKLIQNLKSVRDGNPNKYVNVKVVQKWLDNGVTPEKVEKHIEWFKANYIKGLQAKKKEFNKAQNETVTEEPMNEGLVMWGLFGVVIGIAALYNRIDEAKRKKQNKKNKSTTSDNAIGITEKEINELARQAKVLKSDIIAKQKSSSLYKTLYQYMTKWNTDDYVNAVKALKSGESIDLGLDFRTDVYYSFVEFFDLGNSDFTKQLNDPDDDDEAEKLEIKYESDSFEEMKKHLSSLGFDLNKKIEGRYYSSKKYPDLIIRYVDGDDGTGVIIEPKCTLGADTFKLITEEESKNLNEDHSEISNDPEMEELMTLAGVTVAELDDLDNDNDLGLDEDDPIDANTLREIDAAMDESFLGIKSKKEKNAKELTKSEFDKLINDMVSINDAVISKLKTSKWWKFIYEPCMNIDKEHFDANILASNFKRDFSAGKLVSPSIHPKFIDLDNSDPRVYSKFDKETQKPYSNPKYEDLWEEGWTEGYYEAIKLIKDAVKKLGFDDDGKSAKYPDIEISVSDSECVAIDINPIYTGYYKLKESDKKSQNESAENNLDILLAESAEFLIEE